MQIASQETLGGVKEELAGRRREANECSGKCIQRGWCWWGVWRPLILLFIPINTILSMGACTVGGGTPVLVWPGFTPSPPLLPYTLSPLDAVFIIQFMDGAAWGTVGSLALWESSTRPGELRII